MRYAPLLLLIVACGGTEDPCPDATDPWVQDFNELVTTLADKHEDPFGEISEADFLAEAAARCERVSSSNTTRSRLEMLEQAALIGDAHTGVALYTGQDGFRRYPIWPYWLDGELRILAASEDQRAILRREIVRIAGTDPSDVEAAVAHLISHSNEARLRRLGYQFFTTVEVMTALGFAEPDGSLTIELADGSTSETVTLMPDTVAVRRQLRRPELAPERFPVSRGWVTFHDPDYSRPVSLEEPDENYFFRSIEDVSYVKINRVRDDAESFENFFDRAVRPTLRSARGVVFDLRYNSGGNFNIVVDVIEDIWKDNLVPGNRLFAITDRETFSAAQMIAFRLKRDGGARIVGEETGDTLSSWNNTEEASLTNTGIGYSYSHEDELYEDNRDEQLLPDIEVAFTWDDYASGRDAALEAILERLQ